MWGEQSSALPGYETGFESAPHPFILHRADTRDYRPAIVKILERAAVPGEDLEQAVMAGAPAVINGDEALRIADWLARRANVEWSPDPRHAAIAAEIRAAVLDGEKK